ncbi:MAG: hypothetical protein SAJ12_04715 [Jaaginema sp. PMC 1079.18]|nr:hypothetical protein [Jaaginema sp. PMC 1080.18]MEC4850294.1 hypothetical protein [Jaaginema sp. PMC 1079.18]MEC4865864.1 hypothetical protein [Jaaginema sp. PMC 1078.18]
MAKIKNAVMGALGLRGAIALLLLIFLTACGSAKPPIGLAPGGDIIKSAIALQIEQSQQRLSAQLATRNPDFQVTQINVKTLEPLYLGKLPTFHFHGTYNLKLDLPNQKVTQKDNEFDIYIQRQKEGKTWRWLQRTVLDSDAPPRWYSYLIRQ